MGGPGRERGGGGRKARERALSDRSWGEGSYCSPVTSEPRIHLESENLGQVNAGDNPVSVSATNPDTEVLKRQQLEHGRPELKEWLLCGHRVLNTRFSQP